MDSPDLTKSLGREVIVPLRKRTLDGELYTRDPRIELLLEELSSLSRDEFLERVKVWRRSDPAYIPSECLIYLASSEGLFVGLR